MDKTRFLVGTSGWTYPDWQGVFYPEGLPKAKWFYHYASVFPAVEVNATFYRWFKESTYAKWHERAPEKFEYVLKAPRLITHQRVLKDIEGPVRDFVQSADRLGEKLGLILLQLAPNTPVELDRLNSALETFGDPRRIAVEFRNDRWFTDEIRTLLEKAGAVFCISDSPKIRMRDWLTSDVGYIRLHGRRPWYADEYTEREIEEIAELAKALGNRGARKVFVFFNNDVGGFAVKNARMLMHLLSP